MKSEFVIQSSALTENLSYFTVKLCGFFLLLYIFYIYKVYKLYILYFLKFYVTLFWTFTSINFIFIQ